MFLTLFLAACSVIDEKESPAALSSTLNAGDITYDSIAAGTASTAIPQSSNLTDFSGLTFSIAPISAYAGTQVLPTITTKDGTITTTTSTTAGSYRVTVTPDGIKIIGKPITVDFYVTLRATNKMDLDAKLQQAITDYGLTGDFNYLDTSAVTDMSYLFSPLFTIDTGATADPTRTYIENFNGDISKWVVDATTNFSYMFYGATAFNQDLSGWNIASTDITMAMFTGSGVHPLPNWHMPALNAGDITYDVDRLAQGIAGTATLSSSNMIDLSDLTFSIASISRYIGPGTQEQPTIATNGTITTTATTTAGSYRVTITPKGNTFKEEPIAVDFYVTVKPADIADLDAKLEQGIRNYGLTGDFNYLDTSAVTDMSYLFTYGHTPGTGTMDPNREYVEGFNGDISKWDVSAVKDFRAIFRGASSFNQDIGDWNVAKGTNFSFMFQQASSFNQDIGDWVVDAGTKFSFMFYSAAAFNQDISRWNVENGTDFSYMFQYATAFNQDIGDWNVAKGTDFSFMFYDAKAFNQDIGRWTVSAGKNFRYMFSGAITFNQDISKWVVDAATNFSHMFSRAAAFNQDISGWTVSAGTDFSHMFSGAAAFNQDISGWTVSAGTDFSHMFSGAAAFNQNIGGWTVSAGIDFGYMFSEATTFDQDISKWVIDAATNFSFMFYDATAFNQDLSSWNIASTATTTGMFTGSGVDPLPAWYTPTFILNAGDITYDVDRLVQGTPGMATASSSNSNIIDFSDLEFSIAPISTPTSTLDLPDVGTNGAITTTATTSAGSYRVTITPKGNTITGEPIAMDFYVTVKPANIADLDAKLEQGIRNYGLTGDFNYLDTSEVTTMSYLFAPGREPGTSIVKHERTYIKGFNGDISKWDVSAVKKFDSMFQEATAFNQDISKWNVAQGTDFSYMFWEAHAFNQDISKWNVAQGTEFNYMFWRAYAFNQDIGEWNVARGENFTGMFREAMAFNQDIGEWKVSSGIKFNSMFQYAIAFNQDINGWIVSNGTRFGSMFEGATAFNQDISGWDVSSGKDFSSMFQDATAFNQDIGRWIVSNGTDFDWMFAEAKAFNQDIRGWNVSSGIDFSHMFQDAIAFDQDISGWNVAAGERFNSMFQGATAFNRNIGRWTTGKGKYFSSMFQDATAFDQDIREWDVSVGLDFKYMFSGATTFNRDISKWVISAGTNFSYMFQNAAEFDQDLSGWDIAPSDVIVGMFTGSGVSTLPNWYAFTLNAGDITYDSIAAGTAGTVPPTSSNSIDYSSMTFSIDSASPYVGGTPELPTIAEDGTITTTADTTAGSYKVTIIPDGDTITGNTIIVDFYVAVKPADIGALDTMLKKAIADYGVTGDFNYIDTSAVTNMSYLFSPGYEPGGGGTKDDDRTYVTDFNGDISKWDVSAVENFDSMFYNATQFNQDISKWEVSAVENFHRMFAYTLVFNQDINKWDVSAGKNFGHMFFESPTFNRDLDEWVVSAGTNFSHMFRGARAFNQDIGGWQVNAGKNFSWMFADATVFNQNIGGWIVSNGRDFNHMFLRATSFNQDIGGWDVSAGTDFSYMFDRATAFNQDIGEWNVLAGTDFYSMFSGAVNFNQDLSEWNVTNTDITTYMFEDSGVNPLPDWYTPTHELQASDVTYPVDSIAQGTGSTTTPSSTLTDFILFGLTFEIESINKHSGTQNPPTIAKNGTITTTPTTSAGSYRVTITPDRHRILGEPITVNFHVTVKPGDLAALDELVKQGIADDGLTGDFNYIDTSAVTDMSYLFSPGYTPGGSGTEDATRTNVADFNGDIGKWDVSAVVNFNAMFRKATAFNQDISGWDVSAGKNFESMFSGATAFNQDISGWDVSAGTNFSFMFSGAKAFSQVLEDWNINKDSNIPKSFMFTGSGVEENGDKPSWAP